MELTIYLEDKAQRTIDCSSRKDIRGVSFHKGYKSIRFNESGEQVTKIIPKYIGYDDTNIIDDVKKEIDPNDKLFKHAKEIYDLYVKFERDLKKILK